jgi:hypothetical protein
LAAVSEDSSLELFGAFLRTSVSVLADVGDQRSGSERLLIRGDATGTMQLTELVDDIRAPLFVRVLGD